MRRVSAAVASLLLALGALVPTAEAVPDSYFINRPTSCMASTVESKKPRPLEFCYQYNRDSCCTPGNDAAAKDAFLTMVEAGAGCSPSDHSVRAAYREVRDFICMGCHPHEPLFRFQASVGDEHVGGTVAPNPAASDDAFVWRVCGSWLYGLDDNSGLWGGDGRKFDECGINLPTPCEGTPVMSFDSTTNTWVTGPSNAISPDSDCGTDIIFPRSEYGPYASSQKHAARMFLAALPQWLPNFNFVVVNDTQYGFNHSATPCFRGNYVASATSFAVAFTVVLAIAATVIA
jgi:hypothetical protein